MPEPKESFLNPKQNNGLAITLLVDNIACLPYIAEHGFSVMVEYQNQHILFDTGQSSALYANSHYLKTPLKEVDYLILSHGHYDHGGNLSGVVSLSPNLQFYAHPNCRSPRYSHHPNKPTRSIALTDANLVAIESLNSSQVHWCEAPTQILPGLTLSGPIPRLNSFEDTGGHFSLDPLGHKIDLIPDDMAMWIETTDGLVVICGCCHSGIVNTLEYIKSLHPEQTFNTLIGGLHLLNASKDRMEQTLSYLNTCHFKRIIPAHCTGEHSMELLHKSLNCQVEKGHVGLRIIV
jgi:7,8-dihydropterin-6-yl-methyl-4-(beta-D-ribofuranosyl)aminobenzene 5'-phosphate synthase